MSGPDSAATVLVVDDEPDVADAYTLRLEQEYDVRTAYGGEQALRAMDDDVAVVLLDRRMPDMSGDEVLTAVRDDGYDAGMIMVTAVDPDFDIIDMPFDDYLRKPVDRDTLFEAIEDQLASMDKDAAVSELFSVTAKAGVLEQRKSQEQLEESDEYQELTRRAEELRAEIHGSDATTTATTGGPEPGENAPTPTATADDKEAEASGGLLGWILALFRS